MAIENGVAKPVTVTIAGGELVMNPARVALGHLAGRNERFAPWSPWGQQWTDTAGPAEWLVRAPAGTELTLTAVSEKAGTRRASLTLGAAA